MLENFFDRVCDFGTDTVTRNEGNLQQDKLVENTMMFRHTVYTPPYFVGS